MSLATRELTEGFERAMTQAMPEKFEERRILAFNYLVLVQALSLHPGEFEMPFDIIDFSLGDLASPNTQIVVDQELARIGTGEGEDWVSMDLSKIHDHAVNIAQANTSEDFRRAFTPVSQGYRS